VFITFDDELRAYWASNPDTQHSQNIQRTGQIYLVLFGPTGDGGGLYIQARAQEVDAAGLPHAVETINRQRQQTNRKPANAAMYEATRPQRLYQAIPQKCWVNLSEKDASGDIVRDHRVAVSLVTLLAQ
jgi:hypothetical protein